MIIYVYVCEINKSEISTKTEKEDMACYKSFISSLFNKHSLDEEARIVHTHSPVKS